MSASPGPSLANKARQPLRDLVNSPGPRGPAPLKVASAPTPARASRRRTDAILRSKKLCSDKEVRTAEQQGWNDEERWAYASSLCLADSTDKVLENALCCFVFDAISIAPLPGSWSVRRDTKGEAAFVDNAGKFSRLHPLEKAVRQLVGLARVILKLPLEARGPCVEAMRQTWKHDSECELRKWQPFKAGPRGKTYYCKKDTKETTWVHPIKVVMPEYYMKFHMADRLTEEKYTAALLSTRQIPTTFTQKHFQKDGAEESEAQLAQLMSPARDFARFRSEMLLGLLPALGEVEAEEQRLSPQSAAIAAKGEAASALLHSEAEQIGHARAVSHLEEQCADVSFRVEDDRSQGRWEVDPPLSSLLRQLHADAYEGIRARRDDASPRDEKMGADAGSVGRPTSPALKHPSRPPDGVATEKNVASRQGSRRRPSILQLTKDAATANATGTFAAPAAVASTGGAVLLSGSTSRRRPPALESDEQLLALTRRHLEEGSQLRDPQNKASLPPPAQWQPQRPLVSRQLAPAMAMARAESPAADAALAKRFGEAGAALGTPLFGRSASTPVRPFDGDCANSFVEVSLSPLAPGSPQRFLSPPRVQSPRAASGPQRQECKAPSRDGLLPSISLGRPTSAGVGLTLRATSAKGAPSTTIAAVRPPSGGSIREVYAPPSLEAHASASEDTGASVGDPARRQYLLAETQAMEAQRSQAELLLQRASAHIAHGQLSADGATVSATSSAPGSSVYPSETVSKAELAVQRAAVHLDGVEKLLKRMATACGMAGCQAR